MGMPQQFVTHQQPWFSRTPLHVCHCHANEQQGAAPDETEALADQLKQQLGPAVGVRVNPNPPMPKGKNLIPDGASTTERKKAPVGSVKIIPHCS